MWRINSATERQFAGHDRLSMVIVCGPCSDGLSLGASHLRRSPRLDYQEMQALCGRLWCQVSFAASQTGWQVAPPICKQSSGWSSFLPIWACSVLFNLGHFVASQASIPKNCFHCCHVLIGMVLLKTSLRSNLVSVDILWSWPCTTS